MPRRPDRIVDAALPLSVSDLATVCKPTRPARIAVHDDACRGGVASESFGVCENEGARGGRVLKKAAVAASIVGEARCRASHRVAHGALMRRAAHIFAGGKSDKMQIARKQAHILADLDEIRAVRRPNGRRSLRFLLDADDVTLQVISLGARRTIASMRVARLTNVLGT